jgi:hypothetical protein
MLKFFSANYSKNLEKKDSKKEYKPMSQNIIIFAIKLMNV